MPAARAAGAARRAASLLVALLATAACAAGCREAPPVPTAQPGVDVRHYTVDLTLDEQALVVDARAVLTVAVADSVAILRLTLDGPTVTGVEVDGASVPFRYEGRTLAVDVPPGDTVEVAVGYRGRPVAGLYREWVDGEPVTFTDGWPDRVAGWLPGHHHPSDPATLDLAVRLAATSGRRVLVSGVPAPVPDAAVARARLDHPVPTYAFAFAAGTFTTHERPLGDTLVVRHHRLGGGAPRAALARTPAMLAFFEGLLGPYPHAAYASAEVPVAWAGMENAALAFLRPSLLDDGTAEAVQAHEVAHQWFGNSVVLAGWRDLWLVEGMASYLTILFYEAIDGPDAARTRLVATSALDAAGRAAWGVLVPPPPVDPRAHLGWGPYAKGASALHVLRLRMGDGTFRAALRDVATAYAGRSLSTEAFLDVLARHGAADVDAFARFWLYGDELPTLRTAWDAEARTLTWEIHGDGGTLEGVPFELEVEQDDLRRYVDARRGRLVLPGPAEPVVRPVGVVLTVE